MGECEEHIILTASCEIVLPASPYSYTQMHYTADFTTLTRKPLWWVQKLQVLATGKSKKRFAAMNSFNQTIFSVFLPIQGSIYRCTHTP